MIKLSFSGKLYYYGSSLGYPIWTITIVDFTEMTIIGTA